MKVLSIIDSFKGCATSKELNQAVLSGLPEAIWQERVNVQIADGGEGTLAAIHASLGGEWIEVATQDPLGKPLKKEYLVTQVAGEQVAIIESATFIGLHLVETSDQTIRQASSYGLGLVILDALARKVQRIYVTLGGSATSDGGLGLLQALGAEIQPLKKGNPLLSWEELNLSYLNPALKDIQLFALADVTNFYVGTTGFATVFAQQKGASEKTIQEMERQAQKITRWVQENQQIDLGTLSGAGAAGGLGGAIALLGGQIVPGFATVQQLIHLEQLMEEADLIFTGEGRIDGQTNQGKVPYGVAKLAQGKNIPVIALCGSREIDVGEMAELTLGVFSIQQGPVTLEQAMEKETTLRKIQIIASDLARVFSARY